MTPTYIDGWNDRCHPFVWTKSTDHILKKANRKHTSSVRQHGGVHYLGVHHGGALDASAQPSDWLRVALLGGAGTAAADPPTTFTDTFTEVDEFLSELCGAEITISATFTDRPVALKDGSVLHHSTFRATITGRVAD